jgi:pimeloyl-ACP methyl ester carboxylesterase
MENQGNRSVAAVIKEHEASGKYLQVDGHKIFALDKGNGEAVVCIHGVPTSSFLYRKVINSLADKGYRGICVDLPGLGLSARPEDFDYTFSGLADFLAKAVKELGLEKYHLVVHDIGGPIGFALATLQREKILSITILNTWLDVVNFEKPLVMRPFEKNILGEAELKVISHNTWPIMFKSMGVVNDEEIPSEEIKAYVDLLKREDHGKAFLKIMRNFEDSEEFRDRCYSAVQNVKYPVQAVWGAKDPALILDRYGKEILEIANLEHITELPSKHFLQEEVWLSIADKIDEMAKAR